MAKGQSPALSPETAERYRRVVQLRAAGLTFDRIANELGYASRSGAKEAYDAAIKSWGTEAVDDLRTLEGERIDELWRRTYQRLLAGEQEEMDTGEFTVLLNTAIRLSKRRSEIFGIDAPRQMEISGLAGGVLETDVGTLLRERLERIEQAQQSQAMQELA